MPVAATAYVRAMRGGAQTHLLGASDGQFYVVKFSNNPQGRRILINEFLSCRILEHLKIPTQAGELVEIGDEFIARTNEGSNRLGITLGRSFKAPEAGWHFGSRYPGPPNLTLVHDFIAEDSLALCRNLQHFWGVLLFDKWTANGDSRQSVFYRAKLGEIAPDPGTMDPDQRGLITSFIDHGFCFNGPYWDFPDHAGAGLYHARKVYLQVRGWANLEPWLERIKAFPEAVLDRTLREMPQSWMDEADVAQLPKVCEVLLRRREKVARLIEDLREKQPEIFPYWQ